MADTDRTKEQLIKELRELRRKVAELEALEAGRKQAEEALRKSEERLTNFMNSATEAFIILDSKLNYLDVNQKYLDLVRLKKDEIIGKNAQDVSPDIKESGRYDMYMEVIRTGAPLFFEDIIPHPSFGNLHLLVKGFKLMDGIGFIIEDITERKRAEEKRQTILKTALDGFWLTDLDGHLIEVNDSYCKMIGYPREELLKMSIADIEAVESPDDVAQHIQKIMVQGYDHFETRHRRKDGKTIDIEISVNYLDVEEGQLFVFARDITERKKVEKLLQKTIAELESFINVIPDMAWLKDVNSNFIMANKAFCNAVGKDQEYLINHTCEVCFGVEVAGKFKEDDRKVMAGRKQIIFEESIIDAKKNKIWLETIKSPILDASGNATGTVGIARNITERKQMEEALRESEENFRSLVERANDGICIIQDKLVRYANLRQAVMWGGAVEEIINTPFTNYLHPDELPKIVDNYSRRMAGEPVPPMYEAILRRKDGSNVYAELNVGVVNYSGKPAELVITRDITKRKQAEQALRESEEMFRLLFNSVNDMIFVVEATDDGKPGYVLQVNDTACKKLGYSRAELLSVTRDDIATPDAWQNMLSNVNPELLKTGSVTFESVLVSKDGHIIATEHNTRLLKWKGQRVALSVARDITERKQAEQALRESEEKLAKIFHSSPDGIIISRLADGIILEVNSAWERLMGYSREEALGKSSIALKLISTQADQNLVSLFNKQGFLREFELDVRRKSGDIFRASLSVDGMEIKGERFRLSTIRDITEHKLLEAELQRVEKLESIGTLAGGIAHDFNNLLTAIMGNISLAKRYIEPKGKASERLEEAEKASIRARDLTQQLLTFSRGGAPVKKLVSIHNVIQDSASFALRGSRAGCEFSLPDDLWPVEIDEGQIGQVINNIVINADQAMPDGGIIKIRAKNIVLKERGKFLLPKGKYIQIEIEDNGIGISQKHLAKIFEPYFTTKQKGSGLGLTTAYSIIKNHGGYITVESKQNAGTTFHVYLPASEKPSPAREEVKREMGITGKGKVLVMDDEEVIREMLCNMLRLAGYEVELTSDGAEAIERYAEAMKAGRPFNAVIMDLTIPGGMGGKEAIKKLLEIDANAKVIVSSGYATDPIMSDYKEHGFSAVVTKPYSVAEIEKTLHSLLRKK